VILGQLKIFDELKDFNADYELLLNDGYNVPIFTFRNTLNRK
jgi:hypothetical protein